MTKSSKGQQVKTFTHNEPQPDLSYRQVVGKVYFDAKSGDFIIYAPDHIAALNEALANNFDKQDRRWQGGRVMAKTIDDVLNHYQAIRRRYADLTRDEQRVKVIRVHYDSGLGWSAATEDHHRQYRRDKHSGFGMVAPGLSLRYEILFQADDKLYSERTHAAWGDEPASTTLEYKGSAKGVKLIPWTQEREDFFAQVVSRLEQLIMRIDVFTHDLGENVDLAITSMRSQLALPAPADAS